MPAEGDSLTFTVTLDKAVQDGLKVTPGFSDGTAVEGTDYDENTTALTFSRNFTSEIGVIDCKR